MKNLMDSYTQRHNGLRRKIKTLDEQIPKKEEELEELKKVNAGHRGRSKTEDKKRQKNIEDKKNLIREISKMKAKRRECKRILKEDKKYIKSISLIFKRKTYKTAMNKFNELYGKRKDMSEEIKKYIENLKDTLDDALHHTLNENVPSTNNLIEQYYKITFGRKLKKIFRTDRGVYKRMKANEIRWTKRNVIQRKINLSVD